MKKESVKRFWEARGNKYKNVPFESLSNFEENPSILKERIKAEKEIIFSKILLDNKKTVLDLGAGVGQWAFRFSPLVKKIVAVEYASSQIEIAKLEKKNRNISNVEFIHSSAEDFVCNEKFDIIFISGLIVYLNDDQVHKLIKNVKKMLSSDGVIFLREPSSILSDRYKIVDQYSDNLNDNYSATYRTANEYKEFFEKYGYKCIDDGQIFEEGSSLNKFPETRLRYYIFE